MKMSTNKTNPHQCIEWFIEHFEYKKDFYQGEVDDGVGDSNERDDNRCMVEWSDNRLKQLKVIQDYVGDVRLMELGFDVKVIPNDMIIDTTPNDNSESSE